MVSSENNKDLSWACVLPFGLMVFDFYLTADLATGLATGAFLGGVTFLATGAFGGVYFLASVFLATGAFGFGASLEAAATGGALATDFDLLAAGPAFFLTAARLGDHLGAFLSVIVFGALALLAFGSVVALRPAGLAPFAEAGLTALAAAGLAPFTGAAFALPLAGGAPFTGNDSFFRLKA